MRRQTSALREAQRTHRDESVREDVHVADRTLPHNLDAERSVLGAILLHNEAYDAIAAALLPADFYREAHRRIYAAIGRLEARHIAIDLTTLKEELGRLGDLDEVGGPVYISGLVDGVPRSTNVTHYAGIVREKATLRAWIVAANKLTTAAYDAEESAEEILSRADRAIVELQATRASSRMTSLASSVGSLMTAIDASLKNRGKLLGLETGFRSISELTLGWQAGDLIIIAARPSIGKTTFVFNSACAVARDGKRVAAFSLEMKRRQLEYRILSSLSGIPLTRLMSGFLITDEESERLGAALATMSTMRLEISDRTGQTVHDIRAECRRMKADGGLDLVVIDYVQLIPGSLDRRGATRNDELTDISRRLKQLADDCGVPILALSQLNRTSVKGDNRPKLSDLRDSGALEQDADIIAFLHRRHHREGGYTAFIVDKQRMGGGGTLGLSLDRDVVTFTDGAEEPEPRKGDA